LQRIVWMIDTDWRDIRVVNWLWSVTVYHKTNLNISVINSRHLLKTGGYTRSISEMSTADSCFRELALCKPN